MKESSGKTKKPSKGVKRARSMRNMVMMVLVCVLMLSAATYAWFSLSTAAKVANLSMTVGEDTSLLIAPDLARDGDGTAGFYGSSLDFGTGFEFKNADGTPAPSQPGYQIDAALLPATVVDNGDVYMPNYDANDKTKINSFSTTTQILTDGTVGDTETTGTAYYCYKTSFYLRTAGTTSVDVALKAPGELASDSLLSSGDKPSGGTYIVNNADTDKVNNGGAAAIRIRLYTLNDDGEIGDQIVYEPLSNVRFSGDSAVVTIAAEETKQDPVTSTDKQKDDARFDTNTGKITVDTVGTRVFMQVWIEGSDNECVNQIMGSDIAGELVFTVLPSTSSTT